MTANAPERINSEGYGSHVRTARVGRCCSNAGYDDDCTRDIKPGDRYVRLVASPRADYGSSRWSSMAECAPCHLNRKRAGRTY